MKGIIVFLCAAIIAFGTAVSAYVPNTEVNYFFAGERYGISNIDTDGEIYAGVNENKIAVSRDFQNWTVRTDLDDVVCVQYLNGKFCAVSKGYTYISSDGDNWEHVPNNLELMPDGDNVIKNKGSVVLFAHNDDLSEAGTYQSFDTISWKRVENIPDGIKMNILNGKIIFESSGYMRGIYYSDTGEEFERAIIDGYDESYGVFRMSYNGSEYVLYDYWREVPESTVENRLLYRYSSSDLRAWQTNVAAEADAGIADGYGWIEPSGSCVEIGGEINSFSRNGYNFVCRGGKWTNGDYYGITGLTRESAPFVYYNFTENGVFMWSTDKKSAFIKNSGEVILYDGSDKRALSCFVNGNKFIAQIMGEDWQWESENGRFWIKTDARDEFVQYSTIAENRTSRFESELIERGSWRYYGENREICGVLTEGDGSEKKIVFESTASSDCVEAFGGKGYYLMRSGRNYWISGDGITRDEYLDLDGVLRMGNLYANSENFIITSQRGIYHIGAMAQFEAIPKKRSILVKLSGEYLSFETAPIIENGRTLAPMRFLFERMGAQVDWNDETKTAYVRYGEGFENTVEIPINSTAVKINDIEDELDVPARLVNGKTMLPLRFIAEKMGYTVNYITDTNTAEIIK